jgi:hypothetical protein
MPFENPMESYTREQAMGAHDIEMGIPSPQKRRWCWGETEKKSVIIPAVKPATVKENPNEVIKDLESQQIPVIQKAMATNQAGNVLLDFMSNGTKEFEKRTGRPMTYGEMRAAWG